MASSNFLAVKFFAEGDNSLVVPLFTRVDRRAYFSATLDSLYDHFQTQKLEPPLADLDQVWLSYEGKPLVNRLCVCLFACVRGRVGRVLGELKECRPRVFIQSQRHAPPRFASCLGLGNPSRSCF